MITATTALSFLIIFHQNGGQPPAPQFRTPPFIPKVNIPNTVATPPKLDQPKGYKAVQVPDYIADTYMKFASSETAHDFRIFSVENRVSSLESEREKNDRPDIDSLKETRTKAMVYLAIGTTLITIVWGALAAFLGYLFNSYISPRLRVFWSAISPVENLASQGTQSLSFAAKAEHPSDDDEIGRQSD